MKNLVVINAPFNLGLKQLTSDRQPGVHKLPAWLQQYGLYEAVHPSNIISIESPAYSMELDPVAGVLNADQIIEYSQKLSAAVKSSVNSGIFSLVIGGDCSILLGCAHALRSSGRYALFFLDGHTDYVTTTFSQTKAVAGMDLAIVTGNGHEKLTDMDGLKPYFKEGDVFAVGNRYYETAYVQQIKDSGIGYYDLAAVRATGAETIAGNFIQTLRENRCDGCWIHLDVDVLDDELMPCVDSRQAGGLDYQELRTILGLLLKSGYAAGLDITIFDPDLDPGGRYAAKLIQELAIVLNAP